MRQIVVSGAAGSRAPFGDAVTDLFTRAGCCHSKIKYANGDERTGREKNISKLELRVEKSILYFVSPTNFLTKVTATTNNVALKAFSCSCTFG